MSFPTLNFKFLHFKFLSHRHPIKRIKPPSAYRHPYSSADAFFTKLPIDFVQGLVEVDLLLCVFEEADLIVAIDQ